MKKCIVLSVNPEESCILAEREIIKQKRLTDNITALNVNKILGHIHPDEGLRDYFYEIIDSKYLRYISPNINNKPPFLKIKGIRRTKIPNLPNNIESIRKYKVDGVNIGLAALSTAASFSKCTSENTDEYGEYLKSAWSIAHQAFELGVMLKKLNYDEVYIFNGRHAISRPLAEAIKQNKITKVYYYELDYSRTKYLVREDGFHDVKKISSEIKEIEIENSTKEKYFNLLKDGNLNSEYKKIQLSRDDNKEIVIKAKKRLIAFFTSSIDEFFAIKDEDYIIEDFKNQYEIVLYLAKMQKKYNFRLIIRFHPYLKYKHKSWRYEWNFEELINLDVALVYPTDTMSSYALLEKLDCCVTIGSSIGIESVKNGVPCIEIGDNIGNNLGITVSGNNKEKIEEFIKSPWIELNSRKMIDKYGGYQIGNSYIQIFDHRGRKIMNAEKIKYEVSITKYFVNKIKNLINLKFINKIYTFAYFIYVRKKCQNIINKIDSKMPLNGKLKNGYLYINSNEIKLKTEDLKNFTPHKSLELVADDVKVFNDVFDIVIPICLDYLGEDIIIDSMCVTEIKKSDYKSVSANWHTDNVGHNIKIFICLEGDGSVVTKYIPKSNLKKYKANILEDLRMVGMQNRNEKIDEINIIHKTGSFAIFDSNGQHRGGYLDSDSNRKVFEIEISNKNKAQKLKNLAPIGPRSGQNTFYLENDFMEKFKYTKYLDTARLRAIGKNNYIYGEIPTHYVIH